MPSNPFVALSGPAALGAALLGVSATLFAVDVAGTIALDGEAASSAQALAPNVTQASVNGNQASVKPPAIPSVPLVVRPVVALAKRTRVASATRPTNRIAGVTPHANRIAGTRVLVVKQIHVHRPEIVVAKRPPVTHRIAPKVVAASPHRVREVASLRDVRRFVMRKLGVSARLCAISANAYTAPDGRVIVDLVMRNRHARWTEKAVVRRNGTALKLLGHKAHAMPDRTLAAAAIEPRP